MALITYDDKAQMNANPDIPDVNKVLATDMNEIKTVVNANQVQVTTDGDWTLIKFGESSGTVIGFAKVQVNNINISTSAGGEYESNYINVTTLPSDITTTYFSASETSGSQTSGVHIHRTSISGTNAQVMFWAPASKTGANIPVALTLIGTW